MQLFKNGNRLKVFIFPLDGSLAHAFLNIYVNYSGDSITKETACKLNETYNIHRSMIYHAKLKKLAKPCNQQFDLFFVLLNRQIYEKGESNDEKTQSGLADKLYC